ncbi:MAG: cell division protein FtsL [Mangrovicoccus sp.]
MRFLFGLILGLTALSLAFWAYRENYQTKEVLKEIRVVQSEIADLQDRSAMLRAEWAYLNRPERLRDLVELNMPSLDLEDMEPQHFGALDQVGYPAQQSLEDISLGSQLELASGDLVVISPQQEARP